MNKKIAAIGIEIISTLLTIAVMILHFVYSYIKKTGDSSKSTFLIILTTGILATILITGLILNIVFQHKASAAIVNSHLDVIKALGSTYANVFSVNILSSKIKIYHITDSIEKNYGEALKNCSYSEVMKKYVEQEVFDEDRPLFDNVIDITKVSELLSTRNEYSFIYRVYRNNQIKFLQCCILRPSRTSPIFLSAYKDVDEMMQNQIQNQKRLNNLIDMQSTQLSILSSLCGIYLTSHIINLRANTVAEFNTTKEVKIYVNSSVDAKKQMKEVMEHTVAPDYINQVLAFTDLSTVAKRLNGKKSIFMDFLGLYHGWIRASFITVETDKNNVPYKILFVTQVVDDQKKREEKLIKTANRDELTNCYNRNAYEHDLINLKAKIDDKNLIYGVFDINGLKNINDTLGHEAGDELICGAAECLKATFSDKGKIYRTGGDEFQIIISAENNDFQNLKESFNAITDSWSGNLVAELKISAGYVQYCENTNLSISEIAKMADQRMYQAKSLFYSSKGIDRRAQQAAYETLCQCYQKILRANLTKDEYTIIQIDNAEKDETKGFKNTLSGWFKSFAECGQVHQDDIQSFTEKTDFTYIKKHFEAGNNILSIHYRRKINEEYHNVIMELIPEKDYSAAEQKIFLYVKNIDN